MQIVSVSSVAENLRDSLASRYEGFDGPAGSLATFSHAEFRAWLSDTASRLAWENDSDLADPDAYRPGWEADEFNPSPEDEAAYLALGIDGGCRPDELTPSEQEMLLWTQTDREFRESLQEMTEELTPSPWL